MKKLRSDALWHTFTKEQQKKIEQWLFTDHFSYRKTHALMKSELSISCALSIIGPMFHYLDGLRADSVLLSAYDLASRATDSGVSFEKLHSASKLLLASRFLQSVSKSRDINEIARLGQLMLKHQSSDILRDRANLMARHIQLSSEEHAFSMLASLQSGDGKRDYPKPDRDKPG